MKPPAPFQGFEDPPTHSDPNAPSWKARVVALAGMREYAGRWAKYGPYATNNSASYAAASARKAMESFEDVEGEAIFSRAEEESSYYVYIRAARPGASRTNVSSIFREAK